MRLQMMPQGMSFERWEQVPKGLTESLIQHLAKVSGNRVRDLRDILRDGSVVQFDSTVFGTPVSMLVQRLEKESKS